MSPTFTQMLKHCKEGFVILELFGKYDNYLKWLHEPINTESDVDENFRKERRTELIDQTVKRIDDVGRDESIKLLLNDPEIPYNEWFGSKSTFIDVLDAEKHDPWIKSSFDTMKSRQKPLPTNEKMKFLKLDKVSKMKNQIKGIKNNIARSNNQNLCPKCNSKLNNLGQAIVCTSKFCTYYKSA
jgi:hypothetical protein